MSSNSANGRRVKDPKWTKYIAAIDANSINPDGSDADAPFILDAIPYSEIERISKENMLQPFTNEMAFDFLLLNVTDSRAVRARLGDLYQWVAILVTDTDPREEAAMQATSAGANRGRWRKFWIRVLPDKVTEEELAPLLRFAEASLDTEVPSDTLGLGVTPKYRLPAVGVYDVGQANFCALVDEVEHPLAFFDCGWPISFNTKSKPKAPNFNPFHSGLPGCSAPVILSHLDWDHWGFAWNHGRAVWDKAKKYWKSKVVYKPDALNRPWLMRRPEFKAHNLGPSHIHFVLALRNTYLPDGTRALKIWPKKLSSFNWGPCTIFLCSPSSSSGKANTAPFRRNNESLGMLVSVQNSNARVLLCGDADYTSIPDCYKQGLTGLVAPHHGGAITPGSTPNAVGHGRMVFSTYKGCYSNVPSSDTAAEARKMGWRISETSDRRKCNRGHCVRGNRLIRLGCTPECGCGKVAANCLCLSQL